MRKKKVKCVMEKSFFKEEVWEVEIVNFWEEEEILNFCKEENIKLKKYKNRRIWRICKFKWKRKRRERILEEFGVMDLDCW